MSEIHRRVVEERELVVQHVSPKIDVTVLGPFKPPRFPNRCEIGLSDDDVGADW